MLKIVYEDIHSYYYDPKFHGLDLHEKFTEAREKIAKAATKTDANLEIAAFVDLLNDSHTIFIPPSHSTREEYGFVYQIVGTRCYVTQVRPGSDAEAKGLKPGDELLTLNGFTPDRGGLSKMQYVLNTLYPQTGLRLEIREPSGRMRRVDAMAKARETPAILNRTEMDAWKLRIDDENSRQHEQPKYQEFGDPLMILKLSNFFFTNASIDTFMGKARKHNTLIVDLRGNPGGAQTTLLELLGRLFEQEVKIGDNVTRKKTVPMIAKGKRGSAFTGKLIVLVDSRSGSAAEIFSRAVQIEKRATILGDLTSGKVMAARAYGHLVGEGPALFFADMVSEADFVMTDGNSIENRGVTPDETMLPSNQDLRNGLDPVMARAAGMAGVTLTPEDAGKLFPYEWPKE